MHLIRLHACMLLALPIGRCAMSFVRHPHMLFRPPVPIKEEVLIPFLGTGADGVAIASPPPASGETGRPISAEATQRGSLRREPISAGFSKRICIPVDRDCVAGKGSFDHACMQGPYELLGCANSNGRQVCTWIKMMRRAKSTTPPSEKRTINTMHPPPSL